MSETFSPGDIVVLKSGGPKMTVNSVNEYGVHCQWFPPGDHANLKVETFNADSLKRYEAPRRQTRAV